MPQSTDPRPQLSNRVLAAPKADHGRQPDPLTRGPFGVGQPAALCVPHDPELPEPMPSRQPNGPDITQSSSVAPHIEEPDHGGHLREEFDAKPTIFTFPDSIIGALKL
ncbi:hypothetical protein ACIGXM_36245 [Kitasatospora sp. NPDC052896]|uniref:hypothetical protein n=1 Tax=Kitasatospora sp. NPDC052896 TaxID=3364061 RepID=UPI0037C6D291